MDLTGMMLRAAAARPRVLVVDMPGGAAVRLAAERHLRLRDWLPAATPAQADLLFVAGPPCAYLHTAVERLWQDLPAPRARAHARTADGVLAALDAARARLASSAAQREQEPPAETDSRPPQDRRHEPSSDQDGTEGHAFLEEAAARDGEHGEESVPDRSNGKYTGSGSAHSSRKQHHGNHGGEEKRGDGGDTHEDHQGHDGGGMEMPGGLPMAGQGEDRDGLTLDRLHVPLGPLLSDWPTGLTLRLVLQGDVVQAADLDEEPLFASRPVESFWVQPWLRSAAGEAVGSGEAARRRAAARLDSLGRLLVVAGWPAEAMKARRLRDDLLDGAPAAALASRLKRLARRVGRSRTLFWLTRSMGVLTAQDAQAAGVSGPAARADGDVAARYRQWLTDIRHDVARLDDSSALDPAEESPRGRWDARQPPSAALVALLPRLLDGTELAAARLIVASLDPDLDELAAHSSEGAARG
ncbi:hypothetical protein [Streptomyces sp. AVP053U2]|uniref:hypothetical protein n=1 Tax=Streptomyces sp. AVP053U2 TaxID=1737066 RepID=UPI00073B15DC|nr:hypothetical protein [Streptomyces sp. AVP053U2]ODA71573.1 hypothetical protein APS67_004126 [Streptomyces sp. AVP053U2]